MTGEGFPTFISPPPGLKGGVSPFKQPVSQRMPQPVHQGFTHQAGQSRIQSVYILAIRDIMEQGFHSFVSVEQKQQIKEKASPSQFSFGKGLQKPGDLGKAMGAQASSFGLQGKGQNDFLASTPQYLLPQFQRTSAKSNVPYYEVQQQKPVVGQTLQGFSQPVMNEFNQLQKTFDRKGPQQRFSSEDAESLFIEHYRSSLDASRDMGRTNRSTTQKSQSPQTRELSKGGESSSARNIYAEAYQRKVSQAQKREHPSFGSRTESVARGSGDSGVYYLKMDSSRKKSSFILGSGESIIKMELPHKKPVLAGESIIKMSLPKKVQEKTDVPQRETVLREAKVGKEERLPEQKQNISRWEKNQEGFPEVIIREQISSARVPVSPQPKEQISSARVPVSPQPKEQAPSQVVLIEGEEPRAGSPKKEDSERAIEELPHGKILGQGVKTTRVVSNEMEKPRPDLLKTSAEDQKGKFGEKAFSEMKPSTVEAKVDALLQKLEREETLPQVKEKEQLYKPWEPAMKTITKQQQTMQPKLPDEVPQQKTPELIDQRRSLTTQQRPVEVGEPLKSHFPQTRLEEPELLQRENPVLKMNEEVKIKLESHQTPVASQKPGELAAKIGVAQNQSIIDKKEDMSAPKKNYFEELSEAPEARNKGSLRERSFAGLRIAGREVEESSARKKGDGGPIQAIRGIGERSGPVAGEVALASTLFHQEVRQPSQGKFDFRAGDAPGSHQIVDEVKKDQRQFGGEQGEQGFQGQGRGKGFTSSRMGGTPQETSGLPAQQQQQQANMRQELYARAYKDTIRLSEAKKQEPLQQTQQAVRHATTCIEAILKKSYSETWTGDEMAAKLIAILMKSASGFTYDHSSRVTDLSIALAKEMGVSDEERLNQIEEGAMFHDIGELELDLQGASPQVQARLSKFIGTVDLRNCSFLHDVGKVKIPESILYKPGRLTDEEFSLIKQHPVIGEQIIMPIPSLRHALPVVRHHHERWDGTGYPDGLKGKEIPLEARIVGITDAFDAMVSDRPYRKGMSIEKAIEELRNGAGTQFDPELVEAFVHVIEREYQ